VVQRPKPATKGGPIDNCLGSGPERGVGSAACHCASLLLPLRLLVSLMRRHWELGELIFEVRELAASETHALRRAVSADGRTDLPTMQYELDDAADSWHLGAVDSTGTVVAISSFYRQTCPNRSEEPDPVLLQFMAVDPAVQRQGIGSAVLAEALRRLRSAGVTLLWASARDNAIPFYERFGFSVPRQSDP
jgi:GNAT superfamily N-acetyltransferase